MVGGRRLFVVVSCSSAFSDFSSVPLGRCVAMSVLQLAVQSRTQRQPLVLCRLCNLFRALQK